MSGDKEKYLRLRNILDKLNIEYVDHRYGGDNRSRESEHGWLWLIASKWEISQRIDELRKNGVGVQLNGTRQEKGRPCFHAYLDDEPLPSYTPPRDKTKGIMQGKQYDKNYILTYLKDKFDVDCRFEPRNNCIIIEPDFRFEVIKNEVEEFLLNYGYLLRHSQINSCFYIRIDMPKVNQDSTS